MVLFFSLSQNSLEIYSDRFEFEYLIYSVVSGDKTLSLHDKFEQIWDKLYIEYIDSCSQIILIIKPKASFTDTRIISMWCRTHAMFCENVDFKIIKEQGDPILETNNTGIVYSQAPKIGSKN